MELDIPVVLAIAGVDPSGGAGVFADFRAIEAAGARALGAVTALTVQTEHSFLNYEPTSTTMLANTVRGMAEAFPVAAVKTGMLPTREIVETVADLIEELTFPHVVIDPVMVASVGARLVEEDAERAISERLVPLATLLTPNMPEAAALAGILVEDLSSMSLAAEKLCRMGAKAVVVTGGHLKGEAVDVLVDEHGMQQIKAPREKGSIHGTGCSFASATAAALARGMNTADAIRSAKDYVGGLFSRQQWRVS